MRARFVVAVCLALAALVLSLGAAAAPPVVLGPPASAEGLAVQIIAPDDTTTAASADVTAPPSQTTPAPASPAVPFSYPTDGSIVSAQSTAVSVTTSASDGTASALTELTGVSLFGGELTADDVRGSVVSAGTIGDLSDSVVTGLVFQGTPVTTATTTTTTSTTTTSPNTPITYAPNTKIPLADWGYVLILPQSAKKGRPALPSWRGTVTALDIHLTADHDGLPAGTEIRLGYANAYARPPAAPATRTTAVSPSTVLPPAVAPQPQPHVGASSGVHPKQAKRANSKKAKKTKNAAGLPLLTPPTVTPKLTAGGYVFPVYGPSAFSDTFGAFRSDVPGNWHHGDDIFAPLGAPALAVATGTVFSVGWNPVGGWRLWLRDDKGNEFYYAHLSAYSRLAANGTHVKAGEVLGFVGNTGDAQGTPYHLHFEVHPVSMLFLGYDGAVDPTKYLDAWKKLDDIRILAAVPFHEPQPGASNAPAPGAILLESSDISTANGLDPGSLRRAMNAQPTLDLSGTELGRLPTQLPNLNRA